MQPTRYAIPGRRAAHRLTLVQRLRRAASAAVLILLCGLGVAAAAAASLVLGGA